MPKGRVLTPAEREEITRMHEAGASGREIAKKLARSKTVVLNFLKNPAQYAQIKRSGRKRALSSEDERRLYAALFQQRSSSSSAQGSYSRALAESQSLGGEQEERQQAPDASAAAAVTDTDELTEREERQYSTGPQDIKKSAEQIKKEFNVPLSTRRIQQLLSDWRRDARRAQDKQQQVQQVNFTPPTVRAVVGLDSSDSSAIGGEVIQERSSGHGAVGATSDIVEYIAESQPFIGVGCEPEEATANPAEPATGEDTTPSHQDPPEPTQPTVSTDVAESTIAAPSYLVEADPQAVEGASSELQESSDAMAIDSAEVVADPSSDMSIIQV